MNVGKIKPQPENVAVKIRTAGMSHSPSRKEPALKYGTGNPNGVAALHLRRELLDIMKNPVEGPPFLLYILI